MGPSPPLSTAAPPPKTLQESLKFVRWISFGEDICHICSFPKTDIHIKIQIGLIKTSHWNITQLHPSRKDTSKIWNQDKTDQECNHYDLLKSKILIYVCLNRSLLFMSMVYPIRFEILKGRIFIFLLNLAKPTSRTLLRVKIYQECREWLLCTESPDDDIIIIL